MIVATIIFLALTVLCFAKGANNGYDYEGWFFGGFFLAFITLICFLFTLNFKFGTEHLSGYIYSNEERLGYTTGHIRFSENAGTDEQPHFCAPSDSQAAKDIRKYSGSGKKVAVEVKPYFYFSNNPFACGTDRVTVTEVK